MSLPLPAAGGMPRLRRGLLAASLVLAVVPLSACAAGNSAETLRIRPDNAATTVGDIQIQNAVVIVGEDGENAPVAVSAALINNGSRKQTLDSVTIEGTSGPVRLSGAGGKGGAVELPAGGSVLLGGKDHPSAILEGAAGAERKAVGGFDKVTFDFSETGKVELMANVVPASGYYEDFGPTPGAGGSASPGEAASEASPSASESPAEAGGDEAQSKPSESASATDAESSED